MESALTDGPSRLFIRAVGDGSPLIVVHGGPDFDHEYLMPELATLEDRARVVFYDQRGRGRSFRGEGPDDVSIASDVSDLERVITWTRAETVAVVGHSFGGLLAMEHAIRHPDRVSHLILLNTAPASHAGRLALTAELAARTTDESARRMRELAEDPAYLAGDVALDAERYRLHFGRTVRDRAVLDEIVGRVRRAFTPAGIVAARAIENRLYDDTWNRAEYDLLPALATLTMPVLVVHGEDDFVPLAVARGIADAIPDARLVVLPTSHFSSVERPAEVADLIANFMTAQPRPVSHGPRPRVA